MPSGGAAHCERQLRKPCSPFEGWAWGMFACLLRKGSNTQPRLVPKFCLSSPSAGITGLPHRVPHYIQVLLSPFLLSACALLASSVALKDRYQTIERGCLARGQGQEGQAFSEQDDGLLGGFMVKNMKLHSVWEDGRALWLGVGDRMQH